MTEPSLIKKIYYFISNSIYNHRMKLFYLSQERQKISLTLDEFDLTEADRSDLVEVISRTNIETSVSIHDTHAKGGIAWFPTGLIITVLGLTATGFFQALGEDLYSKFKNRLAQIKSRTSFFLEFQCGKMELYFEFNEFAEDLDECVKKLSEQYPSIVSDVKRLKRSRFESILGKYSSITFTFDPLEKKWTIAHFNI